MNRVQNANPDHYTSRLPDGRSPNRSRLGRHAKQPEHPLKLLRNSYGI
jgi:hypothetical protein